MQYPGASLGLTGGFSLSSSTPFSPSLSFPSGRSTGGWCKRVGLAMGTPWRSIAGGRSSPAPAFAGRRSRRMACLADATVMGDLMSLMCRSMKTGFALFSFSRWKSMSGFSSYARQRSGGTRHFGQLARSLGLQLGRGAQSSVESNAPVLP